MMTARSYLLLCRRHLLVVLLASSVLRWATSPQAAAQTFHAGANFTTQTYDSNTGEPPDTMGAAGPNHFVAFNNDTFAIFNKDGSLASRVSPTTFWTGALGSNPGGLTDPRIVYDPASQRWFAVMITTDQTTNNKILIARSNSADPTSGFKAVSYTTTNNRFADFPTLGLDANGLYVGTNNFTAAGSLSNEGLYSVPKADLLLGTPSLSRLKAFPSLSNSTNGYTLQPAVNYGAKGASDPTPIVANHSTSSTLLVLNNLTGTTAAGATLGTPVTKTVQSYTTPTPSAQPGSATTIDDGEENISGNVVQVGNFLYAVQGTTFNSRTAIRWTVINATTQAIAQQGTISSNTLSYFFPSIGVNAAGDVVVGFSGSSSSTAVSTYAVAGTSAGGVPGGALTFGAPAVTKNGVTYYDGTRWGDYSATTPDPADPGIFWTHQEYAAARAGSGQQWNWATQATEVIPDKSAERRWSNAAGGDFAAGGNYFIGAAPAAGDHVIFSRAGATYSTTFASPAAANRASVRQGTVAWDLGGQTLALANATAATPSLAVAEFQGTAALAITHGTVNSVNALVGGTAGGSGALSVGIDGVLHNTGQTAIGPAGAGSLVVNAQGLADVGNLAVGARGTVNINGGTLRLDGFSNGGTVLFAGGTLQLAGDRTLPTDAAVTAFTGLTPTLNTGQTLLVEGNASVPAGGVTSLLGGTLAAAQGVQVAAGGEITGFGQISVTAPAGMLVNDGSIAGTSLANPITLSADVTGGGAFSNVTFADRFSPGNGVAHLDLGSAAYAGALQIELGGLVAGTEYDQLAHTLGDGVANLGGELDVTLLGAFAPAAGSSFAILSAAGGVSGMFATLNLPTLATGLDWVVAYGENDVTLSVVSTVTFAAADFNNSGAVDGDDLAIWQTGFGTETAATKAVGDADATGAVDGADYLEWQREFTDVPIAATVPEPAAIRLVGLSLFAGLARCRRANSLSR